MEQPKHHEIVRPLIEVAQGIGGFVTSKVADLIVPDEVFDDFMQGGGAGRLDQELYDGDS